MQKSDFWPPDDTLLQKEHLKIAAVCMAAPRMLLFQLKITLFSAETKYYKAI